MGFARPSTARNKNLDTWIEAGYKLYAEEGLAGIQIERLARMLQLNKSSFYHYFGDLEGFRTELINLHKKRTDDFFQEFKQINTIDPDYFHLIVRYKVEVMFQMQILRGKHDESFYQIAQQIGKVQEAVFQKLWSDYLGLQECPHLAVRYFTIIRDVFYARITFEQLDYDYLKKLMSEAKAIMQQLTEESTGTPQVIVDDTV